MIRFTKMQGIGNDYIYVNGFREKVPDPAAFSRFISDRHLGCGSDGLILILPSQKADFQMRMFNADGSEGLMCGNGVRCVAKYVHDYGLTDKTSITLETKGGIKSLEMSLGADGKVEAVRVDMGKVHLDSASVPVRTSLPEFIHQPVIVNGETVYLTCVSMGNPHAVTFVEDPMALDLEKIGPGYEHHPLFPHRVNTEFVRVLDPHTLQMRVWERGSGETMACGTGACASVVAATLLGYCPKDEEITVHLRGGDLTIHYQPDGTVFMTGPAVTIFDGEIDF